MGVDLIRNVINAAGGIADADLKFAYECLNAAAEDFVRQVGALHANATITTVESQQDYDLPPMYLHPAYRNRSNQYVGKYSDGSGTYWPALAEADLIFAADLTDAQSVPRRFAVIEKAEAETRATGTATSAGVAANGEAILTDSAAHFESAVNPGDAIFNTTDESDGYVLSVTDDTHLVAALFNGSANDFSVSDAYVIVPAARKQVRFEAPSLTAGHTFLLPYLRKPLPVYSRYGRFPFPEAWLLAICYGAAVRFLSDDETSEQKTRHLQGLFDAGVNQAKKARAVTILRTRRDPRRR